MRRLSTASEELHGNLPDFRRNRISVQLFIVECGESVDIFGYEVGDAEAGVIQERIAQNNFARTGGAVYSGGLVARHDVSLDVPQTEGASDSAQLRTDLH